MEYRTAAAMDVNWVETRVVLTDRHWDNEMEMKKAALTAVRKEQS